MGPRDSIPPPLPECGEGCGTALGAPPPPKRQVRRPLTRSRLGPDAEFGRPVLRIAFGPDGRWLAVCSEDGEVGLFDAISGQRAGPLLTIGVPICGLAFTPDGRQLLTAAIDGRI